MRGSCRYSLIFAVYSASCFCFWGAAWRAWAAGRLEESASAALNISASPVAPTTFGCCDMVDFIAQSGRVFAFSSLQHADAPAGTDRVEGSLQAHRQEGLAGQRPGPRGSAGLLLLLRALPRTAVRDRRRQLLSVAHARQRRRRPD